MSCEKLKKYLDENEVAYLTLTHSQAFTSQQIAASAHIKGRDFAKTVIVRSDKGLAMVVLPANKHVDFQLLKDITGFENVSLASEAEFKNLFPDCEVGAMPPFGNIYGMEVYITPDLAGETEIAFNGGNHAELIRMAYSDFEKLVKPKVLKFAVG